MYKRQRLAQRGDDEELNTIFSKFFFEGDSAHFINAANNVAENFFKNNFIIKSNVNENIFYQELDRKEYAVN